MKEIWNQRYIAETFVYGTVPNEFFREQLSRLKPGKLLLPAEGEGRNAVYAAGMGWQVTAFDFSEEGKRKAMRLAVNRSVNLEYLCGDISEMHFPPATFDCIAFIYAHFQGNIRSEQFSKLTSSLRPGGHIIFEAFSKRQFTNKEKYPSGGPKDIAMLYDIEEVRQDFVGIEFMELIEIETILNEGELHQGLASVIRFMGIKKA